ncbi:unnamed protein product [Linum trigynum]|uniref:Uncharacterized protein n=1 Tax=Linum trigynum TaxID=586398 RepID=A0AAV2F9R7_9ROSI
MNYIIRITSRGRYVSIPEFNKIKEEQAKAKAEKTMTKEAIEEDDLAAARAIEIIAAAASTSGTFSRTPQVDPNRSTSTPPQGTHPGDIIAHLQQQLEQQDHKYQQQQHRINIQHQFI